MPFATAVEVSTRASPEQATAPTVGAGQQGRAQRGLDRELYEAAHDADLDGMTELLGAGADVNGSIAGDGSPLIGAVRSGRATAVTLLLDRGANPNLGVDGDGSPLIAAAAANHLAIVTLLLDHGANVDLVVPGDENALIQASGAGHLAVVQALVARGADVNARVWAERNRGEGEWRTPLSMARQGRHADVVTFLLSAGARE
jgi:ankyrin repeat protein